MFTLLDSTLSAVCYSAVLNGFYVMLLFQAALGSLWGARAGYKFKIIKRDLREMKGNSFHQNIPPSVLHEVFALNEGCPRLVFVFLPTIFARDQMISGNCSYRLCTAVPFF